MIDKEKYEFDNEISFENLSNEDVIKNIKNRDTNESIIINCGPYQIKEHISKIIIYQKWVGKSYIQILRETIDEFGGKNDINKTINNIFSFYEENKEDDSDISLIITLMMQDISFAFKEAVDNHISIPKTYKEAIKRMN